MSDAEAVSLPRSEGHALEMWLCTELVVQVSVNNGKTQDWSP